jgi:hypothetical protein
MVVVMSQFIKKKFFRSIIVFSFSLLSLNATAQKSDNKFSLSTQAGYYNVNYFQSKNEPGHYIGTSISYKMSNDIKAVFSFKIGHNESKYRLPPVYPDFLEIYESYNIYELKFGKEFIRKKFAFQLNSGLFYWRDYYSSPDYELENLGNNEYQITLSSYTGVLREAGFMGDIELKCYLNENAALGINSTNYYIFDLGFSYYTLGLKLSVDF